MIDVIYVVLGGFLGSILRFFISTKMNKHPFGTWLANISGSFLLAVLLRFYLADRIGWDIWLFAGVGFCGAYTTFSTFTNEVTEYIVSGNFRKAVGYVAGSLLSAVAIVLIVLTI